MEDSLKEYGIHQDEFGNYLTKKGKLLSKLEINLVEWHHDKIEKYTQMKAFDSYGNSVINCVSSKIKAHKESINKILE